MKVKKYVLRKINYPMAAFLLVIIIGSATLLSPPIIGMADNGDFYRVISSNGVYELNTNESDLYNGYFNKYYGIYKYNKEIERNFISTQGIFIKAAVYLSQRFNKSYVLDIRFMSWMLLLAEAVGIYLIIKVLISRITKVKYKIIITLTTILIFCDTGYIAYYNSFYGEAVSLSFFLLSIGILLNTIEFNKYSKLNILMFGISSFIFLGSKQQLAPVGILIAASLLRLGFVNKDKLFKRFAIALSVVFVISSLLFYKTIRGDFDYINTYHAMNRGILLYGDDSEEVMKFFNLDEQYSLLKGTTFYDEVTLINLYDKEFIENYYKKITKEKIVFYFVTHPRVFFNMLMIAFDNAYSIRPNIIGNYEKIQNKGFGEKSYFFALYSSVKEKVFTGNLLFSLISIITYVYITITRYIKGCKGSDYNMIFKEEAYFYIFLVGLSQIIISVIGAGDADLAKHVFMYNVSFDLILIYFISIKLQKHESKEKKLLSKLEE